MTTGDMANWDGMMHAVVVLGSRVADSSRVPRIVPRMRGQGGTLETGIYVT